MVLRKAPHNKGMQQTELRAAVDADRMRTSLASGKNLFKLVLGVVQTRSASGVTSQGFRVSTLDADLPTSLAAPRPLFRYMLSDHDE
jgi:hypothetical protein